MGLHSEGVRRVMAGSLRSSMVVAEYTVRNLESADQEAMFGLLKTALGDGPPGGRDPRFWHWKHVANHFGPSHVLVACTDENELVGMRAFMRWGLNVGDQPVRAVRAVDTVTDPGHRRRGIFSLLTGQMVEVVAKDGADLVFNSPNQDVLPGYLKLGWQHAAKIHPMIKVLNYPAFAVGMARRKWGKPSNGHATEVFFRENPVPVAEILKRKSDLEHLISNDEISGRPSGHFKTNRSWEYLNWRYGEHPTINYSAVSVEHGGWLQGCAIFRANSRFGLKEIVICEMFLAESSKELVHALLDRLRSAVRADYLIGYFPPESFHRNALGQWGFYAVPKLGMNFAVRCINQEMPVDVGEMSNWDLTMGDLELF